MQDLAISSLVVSGHLSGCKFNPVSFWFVKFLFTEKFLT